MNREEVNNLINGIRNVGAMKKNSEIAKINEKLDNAIAKVKSVNSTLAEQTDQLIQIYKEMKTAKLNATNDNNFASSTALGFSEENGYETLAITGAGVTVWLSGFNGLGYHINSNAFHETIFGGVKDANGREHIHTNADIFLARVKNSGMLTNPKCNPGIAAKIDECINLTKKFEEQFGSFYEKYTKYVQNCIKTYKIA